MLSIDFIKENVEKVKSAAKWKNREVDIEAIFEFDKSRRTLLTQINELRKERNSIARQGKKSSTINTGRALKSEIKAKEARLKVIEQKLNMLMLQVPNIPYSEVPKGKSDADNRELKKHGPIPKFSFPTRSHIELIESLDLADLKRGSKVSGFRGYFLKNELALLHMAVLLYAFQKLVKKGYTPLIAPSLVKEFTLIGNGQFPWGKDEVYHLEKDDMYLAGTAEVPVTALYSNEILEERELPLKFVAMSPCFRREAGSYGKDTKGLYRLHEFWKIEQVVIARASDTEARKLHDELQKNTEELMKDLGLAYRVLLMCTADMGEPQAKKYDTEVWMPYRNGYGEIASNSIMTDFQARRLNIKYRKKHGETQFCYTLNDTLVPSPRILIAILENYQQNDGSVAIPKVLQSFCGFTKIQPKKQQNSKG